ncbi:complement component 1 Q subcomponent-binding protein, mitochondrial-like [Mizuhopecten yessoensis]|uniref:N-lysine methyltransferase SETD8-B n=1 Tax=Mizuhopecten yessoensis TaxID=6573 RepID=A0A210QYU1_MIZYE|nr:complement component 1 Q subcomponent-binding protein, mitochondrial-like [Mizuhopecten yessoensis]OWF53894.1 N-lysine methyltransferase SETD8-B [Mizuhopecten yessoensis]
MAGVIARSLSRTTSSLLQKSHLTKQLSRTTAKTYSQLHRSSRSLLVTSRQPNLAIHGKTCRCCLHTQDDLEFSRFLADEISDEEKTRKPLPGVLDWKITKENAEVKLEKNVDNESVTITFNVNNATGGDRLMEEGEGEEGEIETDPPFNVEIKKATGKIMYLECALIPSGDQPKGEGEDEVADAFEITSVTMDEGKLEDGSYTMFSETMDGQVYDKLMDLLDNRGVGDELITAMRDYCKTYDHHLYVNLLSKMKEFVDEK